MAFHIFRKDLRLLWRLALGVSVVYFVAAAGMYKTGHFGYNAIFAVPLLQLFHLLAYLATGFLIIAVVHQDTLPGVRQDWLVRPIKRSDLLLAKFLFVLVIAQGPIFLADLLVAMASGFPLSPSISASGSRSVYLLLSFDFPILLFAAVTRNLTEAAIGGLLAFVGYVGFQLMFASLSGAMTFMIGFGNASAVDWVTESFQLLLLLVTGLAVLRIQYWRRKTHLARWLVAGIAILCLFTGHMPWQSAFALQERMSRYPGAAGAISVAFHPSMGPLHRTSGVALASTLEAGALHNAGMMSLSLPIQLSGLRADTVVKMDRSDVRAIGEKGEGVSLFNATDLEVWREDRTRPNEQIWQRLLVPTSAYKLLKSQPVRLEVSYSLTLLTLSASHAIPAVNGDGRIPGVGWCQTRVDDAETHVDLSCLQVGNGPTCGTAFLEYPHGG